MLSSRTTAALLKRQITRPRPLLTSSSRTPTAGTPPFGARGFLKNFKPIQVTNPVGLKLLRGSKLLGKSLVLFYVVISGTALYYYFRNVRRSDVAAGESVIPEEWPFSTKGLYREALIHDAEDRFEVALKMYDKTLVELIGAHGEIPIDGRSPEWLSGYADLLARKGRILELFERSEEARAAFQASYDLKWGSHEFKSIAAIQLGKYAAADGDLEAAEQYHIAAIHAAAPVGSKMAELLQAGDVANGIIIPPRTEVSDQLYNAEIELGKFWATTGKLAPALDVFLGTLRSVKEKRAPKAGTSQLTRELDPKCFEARVMEYIGEIMWARGQKQDAVTWVESSYYESYPMSSTTVECGLCATMAMENATKMYHSLGLEKDAEKSQQRLASLNPPVTNYKKPWTFMDILASLSRN
ncbi:hypothetical protein DV495_003411 [Geotrichum candidum]|uniref:Uncharacterized protein n=1 Tax=Geotrichum candidum TaxID=1173061 RepID=A0A0J9X7U8_GEOCN|nr:hypothetical protein DV452_005112 [Geotrichum candidum]KAI9214047.1 hypothetical protein DS838_001085 [Geotrichum bryndzae]KAF5115942.1 hypothetical protein DV454_002010 [Geotrichum candidum]KAF5126581.1 hypothetical protein DV495_003411 [Geotrichum candidum]KAF7499882.1 hypothetical protein DV113_002079 [Geotrichum candidum]